jgi:ATP-dependent protease ClpP protease subunit|tara:strand:+ start:1322 stop:1954 length:633 start_codon:yes stop_codon:yes gene_type:complete
MQYTKKDSQKNGNRDLMELLGGKKEQRVFYPDRPLARAHEFYLTGTIESAENYTEWFDIIRHAGKNDAIQIYINSYGGDLFTAIQFLRVLGDTEATVIISVEGACMSAASMIFLYGDAFEISSHSMFMFHNYSGGTFGKGGEMLDQLQHERVWSEKLLREIYSDFLTEQEIVSMLNNKDLWMDGDEVIKRLEKRSKKVSKTSKDKKDKKK